MIENEMLQEIMESEEYEDEKFDPQLYQAFCTTYDYLKKNQDEMFKLANQFADDKRFMKEVKKASANHCATVDILANYIKRFDFVKEIEERSLFMKKRYEELKSVPNGLEIFKLEFDW